MSGPESPRAAENRRMLRLLAHHTRIIESKTEQGETTVLFEPR